MGWLSSHGSLCHHEFKPVLQVLQDNGWSFITNPAMLRSIMFLRLSTIITSSSSIFAPLIMGFLSDPQTNHFLLHGDGNCSKVRLVPAKGGCSNYFSLREILHHVQLDYKKHCSMPLLSYVLTHDEPTLTNTVHMHALDCLFVHVIKNKQGG